MLQDASNNADDIFAFYLQNGSLLIAQCHHIDDEKFLVMNPHFISIMVDEVGNKASFLMPMASESIIESPVSHFYYCDVITMYKPKEDFKEHFLKVIHHDPATTVEKTTPKKEEVEDTGEKVISVDFKTKKRKPSANTTPVVETTEPEPDGVA